MENRTGPTLETNTTIDKAYDRAKEILSGGIQLQDFSDIYKDVENDQKYVETMEKLFSETLEKDGEDLRKIYKLSAILEAIVLEEGELSNWFGENATTIIPSRFDDIRNGIDCIVEFEEGDTSASHLALAVDVVSGAEIQRKMNRIKNDIEEGHLSEIKYFSSDRLGIKGKKINIPKVVIGADRKHVQDLVELWLNNRNKELAEHHMQIQILKEIKLQLDAFAKYAERKGRPEIAEIYRKALSIVRTIIREKKVVGDMLDKMEEDEVYKSIQEYSTFIGEELL